MIALFRCLLGLDGSRALVQRRIPLVGLAADKAIEVLETAAPSWPGVEGPMGLVSQTGTS